MSASENARYEFHGVVFSDIQGTQQVGTCPFCGKEKHFYVSLDTGLYDCKKCGSSGNPVTFLGELVRDRRESTSEADWKLLSQNRGLPVSVLKQFNLAYDQAMSRWLIPYKTSRGTLCDVRTFELPQGPVISTRGCKLSVFNIANITVPEHSSDPIYICEGEWDTIALTHLLQETDNRGIAVGVPGAGTFKPEWANWFAGRNVTLCYDNDDAGDDGAEKAAQRLSGIAASTKFLCWPYSLSKGYDLRDLVKKAIRVGNLKGGWKTFAGLIKHAHRRRNADVGGKGEAPVEGEKSAAPVKKIKLKSFREVVKKYSEFIEMTPAMTDALRLCYAVTLSNQIPGDPLWLFIVSPPGSGKTMLVNTLADVETCIFRSSVTPHSLVSGFRGEVDPSLIPQLHHKVFVMKDYTEILAMNQQDQEFVLGILRGAYDGRVEKSFGNGVQRFYECHFSMLAGVTHKIHGNQRASLGERFLKFQIVHNTSFDASKQIRAAMDSVGEEAERETELRAVAAGYLDRKIELTAEQMRKMVPTKYVDRMVALAQLVAMLRAEVDRDWSGDSIVRRPQHEMGTRLAKQLKKLAIALCLVEGKTVVDDDIYRLVERVGMDTALGFHLDVVQAAMKAGGTATREELSQVTRLPTTNMMRHLEDLVMLKIMSRSKKGVNKLGKGITVPYVVTPRVRELWNAAKVSVDVVGMEAEVRRTRKEIYASDERESDNAGKSARRTFESSRKSSRRRAED